ncbi:MAG: hypothetical protein B6I38_09395 [Anaerolineaceae bacterium 4572_5.1]|nr:MAG: hypothetical protein B6I38_09395 [Anaerolineaceae bacterium 4572_5.1]
MLTEHPLKILVVDDDFVNNKLLCQQLQTAGHQVVNQAYNGKQAIEMTKSLNPDIVLMDMQMKNPDTGEIDIQAGIKASRLIQEQCPTPIVIISAHKDPTLIKEANKAGVGAYLIKPSNLDEIERTIAIAMTRFNDLMEVRRLNKELQNEISRRVKSEKIIKFMATHDPLTSLPNRWLFNDRMNQEIAHAKRNQQKLGVIFLEIVQKILTTVSEPLTINEQAVQITSSIGIAIYPHDGEKANELIKNADSAMYYIKKHGRNNYHYYNADAE